MNCIVLALLNEMPGLLDRPWEYVDMSYIRNIKPFTVVEENRKIFLSFNLINHAHGCAVLEIMSVSGLQNLGYIIISAHEI